MNILCNVRHDRDCRRQATQLLHAAKQRGMNRERIRAAIIFADSCHLGQTRKTGEAFIIHPLLVSFIVLSFGDSEDDVIAALLHDTKEDNPYVSLDHINRSWGMPVAHRVAALSKNHSLPAERRLFDAHGRLLQAVAELGLGVAAIKIADRCHNSATSQTLTEQKQYQLQIENQRFFAPLAQQIGARGLAQFLSADPPHWWRAAHTFVHSMLALQPAFLP